MGAPDNGRKDTAKKKAFFSGLHGVITGMAALITASVAVAGLALSQGWLNGGAKGGGTGTGTTASTAAVPQYAVAPASIAFAPLGPTTAAIEVSNTGVVAMTVEPPLVTGPNASHFGATSQTCDAPVEPGRSCQLEVTFTQAPGTFNAIVVVRVTGAVRAIEVPVKATAIL